MMHALLRWLARSHYLGPLPEGEGFVQATYKPFLGRVHEVCIPKAYCVSSR